MEKALPEIVIASVYEINKKESALDVGQSQKDLCTSINEHVKLFYDLAKVYTHTHMTPNLDFIAPFIYPVKVTAGLTEEDMDRVNKYLKSITNSGGALIDKVKNGLYIAHNFSIEYEDDTLYLIAKPYYLVYDYAKLEDELEKGEYEDKCAEYDEYEDEYDEYEDEYDEYEDEYDEYEDEYDEYEDEYEEYEDEYEEYEEYEECEEKD